MPNNGPTYDHTSAGRLATRTWKRGITTTYYYDLAGDLRAVDYSDTATPDVFHTRDRLGRATTSAQGTLAVAAGTLPVATGGITVTAIRSATYGYDPATLAPATEAVDYGGGFTQTLTRTYEDGTGGTISGRPNGHTFAGGSATWTYDNAGRPSTLTDGADTFTYGYAPGSASLIASVTKSGTPALVAARAYEPARDVLASIENKVGSGAKSSYTYTVNSLGQRTNLSTTGEAFAPGAAPALVWQYDNLGQLEQADSSIPGQDRAYQYDAIGNREKTASGLLGDLPAAPNWIANALNQYTVIPQAPATPGYDGDGNMTTGPLPVSPTVNSTLVWDAENRLIEVKNGGDILVEYTYDAQSRRIAAVVDPDGTPATTLYVYDGWNCIAEYTGSVPAIARTYLWGLDLSGSPQGAGGVGGLLSVSEISNGQISSRHYPTYDGNGNVSEYLTAAGTVAAHFEYDPFGNTVVNTDNTNQFAYRFSTKPQDPATGLLYYGYRWYDPLTGRWPSRDPIEESGGVNLYEFVGNEPSDRADVLGLWKDNGSYIYVAESGDTITGLAKKTSKDSKDSVCLWPVKSADSGGFFNRWGKMPERWAKDSTCPGDTYDASNLVTPSPSAVSLSMILEKSFAAVDKVVFPGAVVVNGNRAAAKIRSVSGEGATPINNFVMTGHSGPGLSSVSGTTGWWIFSSLGTFDLTSLTNLNQQASFDRAKEKKGPLRCWFTRDNTSRFVACSSQTLARNFASQVLRKGSTATGTDQSIGVDVVNGNPIALWDYHTVNGVEVPRRSGGFWNAPFWRTYNGGL